MNFHALMLSLLSLTLLVSCGQDIAKKGKGRRRTERSTPPITPETSLINSQIHRLRGLPTLSYLQETELTLSNTLSPSYRLVPQRQLDDEGTDLQNVLTVGTLGRPNITCGVGATFTGIEGRLTDCVAKNSVRASWSGEINGAAGEGTWRLVARTDTGAETWLDSRTGMVWSDVVATTDWCKASGNKQNLAGSSVNCTTLGGVESVCFGTATDGIGPNIKWRLPTRNDFLQADINGLRFVLKKGTSNGHWTATMQAASTPRDHAWVYHLTDGTLSAEELSSSNEVRCIGAAVK